MLQVGLPGRKKPSANLPRLETSLCSPDSGRPTTTVFVSAVREGAPGRSRKPRSKGSTAAEKHGPPRVGIAATSERAAGLSGLNSAAGEAVAGNKTTDTDSEETSV